MNEQELIRIVEDATLKFWESISNSLPEIKTGDLDPQTNYRFERQCREVVKEWFETNRKDVNNE